MVCQLPPIHADSSTEWPRLDNRAGAITWFSGSSVFPHFGLPRALPQQGPSPGR
jgi:hypothetical protein